MSYLCIKKQEPTAGAKGIMCGGVFLPTEDYDAGAATPASQIPSEGLALYVPLSEAPNASEWTEYGSITYKTIDGVPYAYFNGDNSNGLYMGGKAFETQTFTVSIVFNTKSFSPTSGYMPYLVNFGPNSTNDNDRLALRLDNYYSNNKNALVMVYNGNYLSVQNLSTNTWYSAQMKFDGTQISLYLNGELQSQLNVSAMEIQSGVWIGKSPSNDGAFNGYLSSMRVYNRALSDEEIALLAREFVFNSAPLAGRKGLLVPVGESVVAPPANGLVFHASYAEDMTDSDGESPVDGTGYTIVEDAAGFKCLNVEKSNMQNSISYAGTQEKMQFGTGNFTIAFFMKSVKPWSDYNGVVLATKLSDGNSGAEGFVFYKNRDSGRKSIVVRYADSSQQGDFYSSSDVDTNWHHWMFMRAGNALRWYKDGILDAERGYTGGIGASANLNIGGYYSNWSSSTSAYFRLSNVRIYNRALTDAEIQSVSLENNPTKSLFIPLQTAHGTPQAGQKGIIVRSSQVVGCATYSKSTEAMPTEGLVFYAPLEEETSTTATGQTLSKSGTVTYQKVEGLPCARFDTKYSYLSATVPNMAGVLTGTISLWIYISNDAGTSATNYPRFFTFGDKSKPNNGFICGTWAQPGGTINYQSNNSSNTWPSANYPLRKGRWINFVSTVTESGFLQSYVNGEGGESCELGAITINDPSVYINYIDGDYGVDGIYIADVRMYNRILSASEIKTLAGEYKQEEVKKMFIAVKEQSAIPDDGLIFYAPLEEEAGSTATGQTLSRSGTVTYGTESGVPCACFNGNGYLYFNASGLVTMSSDWAISLWIRFNSFSGQVPTAFAMGSLHDIGTEIRVCYYNGKLCFEPVSLDPSTSQIIEPALNVWYHICIVHSGSLTAMYSDGVQKNEKSFTYSFTPRYGIIGNSLNYNEYFKGWISAVRIYNRALDVDEISALANEYTPEA